MVSYKNMRIVVLKRNRPFHMWMLGSYTINAIKQFSLKTISFDFKLYYIVTNP